jgi:ectoine hydroxylase-related dioxygenase (phytanoyl-CoA dioxygenase family)
VLVGAAQVLQRDVSDDEARDPLALMEQALRAAADDAEAPSLLAAADSIRVPQGVWRHANPAAWLGERFGAAAPQTALGPVNGSMVQRMLSHAAREIRDGRRDVVLLASAECERSRRRARRAGRKPAWSVPVESSGPLPDETFPSPHPDYGRFEVRYRPGAPQAFALYENALRHHAGRSLGEHARHISELWEGFSRIAADNPFAWIRQPLSAEAIRTPGPDNRMIAFPYTKYLCANMVVDMGAALVLCSVEAARRHGVPESRWIFPHAATDVLGSVPLAERWTLHDAPAIGHAGRRALALAGVAADALDEVDLYSCFPAAVQLGARELGLSLVASAHRHRRAHLRRRSAQQLRDALHRHDGLAAARAAGRARARQLARRLRGQARLLCLRRRSAARGLPVRGLHRGGVGASAPRPCRGVRGPGDDRSLHAALGSGGARAAGRGGPRRGRRARLRPARGRGHARGARPGRALRSEGLRPRRQALALVTREPLRSVSEDEVATFERDGVVCLRGVMPAEWLARMEAPIEEELARALGGGPGAVAGTARSTDLTRMARRIEQSGGRALADGSVARGTGRFIAGTDHWRESAAFRAFACESPLPALAARLLRSRTLHLYEDSLLVKEPGTAEPTAFHQDMAYFHVEGTQVCTTWCPLDPVTRESGAVTYVRGSHRWGRLFRPNLFVSRAEIPGTQGEALPDIDAHPEAYDRIQFDLEPGDVTVHHALTLHGAGGNASLTRRRRAISVRYAGDDARFHRREGAPRKAHHEALREGEPLRGPGFPRAWPG